jgi:predicted TIM-barrel fold metal-dependent hydrolase
MRASRALRILAGTSQAETAAFAAGEYDNVFAAASDCGLPLFVAISGNAHLLPRYLEKFRDVKIIVDHCGMPPSRPIRYAIAKMEALPDSEEYWSKFGDVPLPESLERVLLLSAYPNVAIKWAHSSAIFEAPAYPNEAARPFLRSILNAFGANRVMWASDISTLSTGETWAEVLFSVVNNPDLSKLDREHFLGRSVRDWLNWEYDGVADETPAR